ncbi:hypothetical protein SAMN05421504_104762 [Amycolatopsis xylanica]|uniref:SecDF P1 head subdomain domain-containing protein n=1 Tax=Amycolatopsis xylanica TaxID=589385 RepID=A0A1H3HPI5_9PSEU|nr:hypothetical protein [Amycolatopsis xylanica]SDY17397.1 hypothetical protein SAMN05421504_104762 [Amycolatopsis xylanica]
MRWLALVVAVLLAACSTEVPGTPAPKPALAAASPLELRFVVEAEGNVLKDKAGVSYRVGPVVLVLAEFTKASVGYAPASGHHVRLELPDDEAAKFARFTMENVGKQVAMVVAGKIAFAPVIERPVSGGVIQLDGEFTAVQAQEIVDAIKGGS